MNLKLGKLPAKPDKRDLFMSRYFTGAPIPTANAVFGHYLDFTGDWLMLGNDKFGCCVPTAFAHLLMMWRAMWKRSPLNITEESNLACYSEITALMGAKFDPTTGTNDTGCDMHIALNWFKNVGYLDADGNRHTLGGYGSIDPSDANTIINCANLFDGVDCGFQVPQFCMNQFQNGQPWDRGFFQTDSQIVGGHSVPIVGRNNYIDVITWEKTQGMTQRFMKYYFDEVYVLISEEQFNSGKSPEGFAMDQFMSDLASVQK